MDLERLGRILHGKRVTAGLSREELAEAIGVHAATVGAWERGENPPAPPYQGALAEALETPLEELAVTIATLSAA